MKSFWILSITILLSWNGLAQDRKNEILIGINGADHFDNSPYRLNRGGAIVIPTNISYTRNIKKNWGIMLDYNNSWFGYSLRLEPEPFQEVFQVGERSYTVIRTSLIRNVLQSKLIHLKGFFGLSLRIKAEDLIFSKYNYGGNIGTHWEPNIDVENTKGIGAGFGFRVKLKVYKNISLAVDTRYTRYISNRTHNEMINSLLIGYSFGGKSAE